MWVVLGGREGVVQARELALAQPPPYPLKTTHICLCNYLISVHVQPENGQHQWPKHVVVPNVGKGISVPLQVWSVPEGSRELRFPDFMITAQEGGKVVSLTHRPHLPPGNSPGTHFC